MTTQTGQDETMQHREAEDDSFAPAPRLRVTVREAGLRRMCMICGEDDALLLRLPDGRNVRACSACLRGSGCDWSLSYEIREPLPIELPEPYTPAPAPAGWEVAETGSEEATHLGAYEAIEQHILEGTWAEDDAELALIDAHYASLIDAAPGPGSVRPRGFWWGIAPERVEVIIGEDSLFQVYLADRYDMVTAGGNPCHPREVPLPGSAGGDVESDLAVAVRELYEEGLLQDGIAAAVVDRATGEAPGWAWVETPGGPLFAKVSRRFWWGILGLYADEVAAMSRRLAELSGSVGPFPVEPLVVEACGSRSPRRAWPCTLPRGHSGDHANNVGAWSRGGLDDGAAARQTREARADRFEDVDGRVQGVDRG